jgi:hypothetical protein
MNHTRIFDAGKRYGAITNLRAFSRNHIKKKRDVRVIWPSVEGSNPTRCTNRCSKGIT